MRFVVADDSRIPRDILRSILAEEGHECVASVANGLEAIDACRKHKPDAVILDVSMPVMGGDVAAKVIVDEQLATHVIIASSMSQAMVFAPLQAIGAHVLAKPYRSGQMKKFLQKVLG